MQDAVNFSEIPVGLGMALAENLNAMQHFAALPPEKQREIIRRTKDIDSSREMRRYVRDLRKFY